MISTRWSIALKNLRNRSEYRKSSIEYRKACILFLSLAILHIRYSIPLFAQAPDYPVFVEQVNNPNDYSLFANAGWDGNWYVGYNNGWIKKFPPISKGNFAHAYLGAKLGRMKTLPPV